MSSEALREAKVWLEQLASADRELVRTSGLAAALLDEVARLEQERDEAREKRWETVNETLAALAVAREREQRLAEAGEALAERVRALVSMNDHRLSRERSAGALRAWAALVDEPAADELIFNVSAAPPCEHCPGEATACDGCPAAADEPGEAPQVRRGVGRIVGHRERPPMVVGDDEARGGVSPSGKERGE